MAFVHEDGRTRLSGLHQSGCAKIRLPRGRNEAILINTSGGLTGGDRLAWDVELGAGAAATVTTQAAERLYRAPEGEAAVTARLRLGTDARLAWLPQETIAFEGSAMRRRLDVEMNAGARLLVCEAFILGRTAMGERVHRALLRDRWRVRRDGCLVHAEALALGPDVAAAARHAATLGGAAAFATVLLVADDAEAHLAPVRAVLGETAGASAWDGRLVVRLVAPDGFRLRATLMPLLAHLLGNLRPPADLQGTPSSGQREPALPRPWLL